MQHHLAVVSRCSKLLYNTVILAGFKFGGWALNRHCKTTGGFKFVGLVKDCHTYICKYEILVDFNLAAAS